jgi:hypothetical protein
MTLRAIHHDALGRPVLRRGESLPVGPRRQEGESSTGVLLPAAWGRPQVQQGAVSVDPDQANALDCPRSAQRLAQAARAAGRSVSLTYARAQVRGERVETWAVRLPGLGWCTWRNGKPWSGMRLGLLPAGYAWFMAEIKRKDDAA